MRTILFTISLLASVVCYGANSQRTVTQVSTSVVLSSSVDYHITSTTPFTDSGSIDIQATNHAVVIFDNLRPSKALTQLSHITINGTPARNNNNCQVRIYGRGSIVYPYANNIHPLTVFTESYQKGDSCNSFGLEHSNGFMNTLTEAKLNNRIKSFSLKRGYMVTFSTARGGYGYSRCFIADDEDLKFTLPAWLQNRITSYRLFKWNDVSKCGWGGTQPECMSSLNATWCYEWGAPDPQNVDWECVPQHHHEGWPAIDEVGRNGTSCHALGNNEPDNQNDASEQYQTVEQVLANWPQMMATGKRLGTPAMAGNRAWLKQFCDSIDARGWRADFCAVHLYFGGNEWDWDWNVNDYFAMSNNRPVWITEMNSGAEWTDWWGGGDRSANANNYQIQKDHFAPVLDMLARHDKVERIAPFNSFWIDKCRMFYNWDDADPVTPIGHHYANLQTGLAYSGKYDKVPSQPRMAGPQEVKLTFSPTTMINTVTWKDTNGDFNTDMWVERRSNGEWQRVMTARQIDGEGNYTYRDTLDQPRDYAYRVALKTVFSSSRTYYSQVLTSSSSTSCLMTAEGHVQWGVMDMNSSNTNGYGYFSKPFDEQPALVFGSPSNNNAQVPSCEKYSAFSRNDEDLYNSFTFCFFPWTLNSQTAFTNGAEHSVFIAAFPGTGSIGTLGYETGYITGNATAGKVFSYTFTQPFASVPVVIASPYYRYTSYPFMCRVFDVTTEGFKVLLQRQKGLDNVSGLQNQSARIAFFAIEQGETIDASGRQIVVATEEKSFNNKSILGTIEFSKTLRQPKLLLQMQSRNREELIAIIRQNVSSTEDVSAMKFRLQYDPTNTCVVSTANPINESFGWIAIGETDASLGITPSTYRSSTLTEQTFDLQGRRVGTPSRKGIYIKNGNKYIVK